MLSQKEIARRLNLSQATVSRALRNDKALPLETILKVKELVRETGFTPRRYTRRKPSDNEVNRSHRLLALVCCRNDEQSSRVETIALEIIQGLIRKTKEKNIELIVRNIDSMSAAKTVVAEYTNSALGCLAILRFPNEIINYLNNHFNCLSINHHYDGVNVKVVEPDQESAFFQMYRIMHERGHRKIGFLTITNSRMFMFRRYTGFLRGSRQSGDTVSPDWVLNVAEPEEYEFDAMVRQVIRLRRESGVTAFLCTSGSLAKNLIDALERQGVRVPDEISFGAFDEVVIPMESGHQLFGAQASYDKLTESAIHVLQHFELFQDISCLACPPDFLFGNTVAEISPDAANH